MTEAVTRRPFRLTDPPPTGTTVLEASAGTGKTWTLAALATLYVADGTVPIERLLMVTFSRGATRELRARVRDRMVQAAAALSDPVTTDSHDPLIHLLHQGDRATVASRAERLRTASTSFDAATIATIHQFSHRMLTLLGMAGDLGPGETFDPAPHDLADDVAEERLVLTLQHDNPGQLDDTSARSLARTVCDGDPRTPLLPEQAEAGSVAAARVDWARQVRDEVEQRRRDLGRIAYDQQLTRLRDVLTSSRSAPAAVQRLRARFGVVLVDEFQDTDAVQWQILQSFAHGWLPLVLIGDPKQAIYGFRGADVHSYLDAVSASLDHRTLDHNWRSDEGVVRGVEHLLDGVALGDPRISVRPIRAARTGSRLGGAGPPVQLRIMDRDGVRLSRAKVLYAADAREAIRHDLVAQVVEMLEGSARVETGSRHRRVEPADIAVLVRVTDQGEQLRGDLVTAGVPAVLNAARDVFSSPAAQHLAELLEALERPSDSRRQRTAMIGPLVGLAPEMLVGPGSEADDVLEKLGGWRRSWVDRGPLALLDDLVRDGMAARLARRPDGDRLLTDLKHVAESMHVEAARARWAPRTQVQWLQQQRARGQMDDSLERSRRLEKDARAVQVMTVHAAKGLEFPVVMLPFEATSQPHDITDDPVLPLHQGDRRVLHVGGHEAPGRDAALLAAQQESAGEFDRAHYVALTRAASRLVLWWAPTTVTARSPLHRLLFGGRESDLLPASAVVPSDEEAWRSLSHLAATSGGHVQVEQVRTAAVGTPDCWSPPQPSRMALDVATFDRELDLQWRRTSYSGLVAGLAHEPEASSEVEQPGTVDEPTRPTNPAEYVGEADRHEAEARRLRERRSAWADLPAGAWFGTLVHGVLEQLDTSAQDFPVEVASRVREALARRIGYPFDADDLVRGLVDTAETPLGPGVGHRRLRDIAPSDRLSELGFELPLAGGDTTGGVGTIADSALADVGALMSAHLPPDDPLRGYADVLHADELGGRRLRGYLLGSIDAVLRIPHPRVSGEVTYLVVDYKTNVLRDENDAITPWAYRPDALAPAMIAAHYPLQALLYSVALHRFLRWRLGKRYDPAVHLGGVQYHFLRGMVGQDAVMRDRSGALSSEVCGVLSWAVPAALVTSVSDLLATGGSR